MTSIRTEVRRQDGAQVAGPGRNPERAALRVQMDSVADPRTKAETIGLMEAFGLRMSVWWGTRAQPGSMGSTG